jgi:hypothetical protein
MPHRYTSGKTVLNFRLHKKSEVCTKSHSQTRLFVQSPHVPKLDKFLSIFTGAVVHAYTVE